MASTLPPGMSFCPSPHDLLRHYLKPKNILNSNPTGLDGSHLIKELNLYDYAPFNLPEIACFRYGHRNEKRHWFCYAASAVEENADAWRRTGGGYWKRNGNAVAVTGFGGVLGTRAMFVFYRGRSLTNVVRTRWCMYEYALPQNLVASFVLCRVFNNSLAGNGAPYNILSSRAEESGSAGVHICIQNFQNLQNLQNFQNCQNFQITSDIFSSCTEESSSPVRHIGIRNDDNSINGKDETSRFPFKLNDEPDDPAMTRTVYAENFRPPQLIPLSYLVMSGEEDFIELDDLVN